jgi:hypothetical protein
MKKMLYNRRGILAIVALLGCVAVAIGAVPFLYPSLPDPEKADQQQLLHWLVLRDLGQESPARQLTLALRLESEFGEGVDWSKFKGKLSLEQIDRLIANIPHVLRPWILEKSVIYEKSPDDRRLASLDQVIATLEVWQGVETLLPPKSETDGNKTELKTILTGEMNRLLAQLPKDQKKTVEKFWGDLKMRWVLKKMGFK